MAEPTLDYPAVTSDSTVTEGEMSITSILIVQCRFYPTYVLYWLTAVRFSGV